MDDGTKHLLERIDALEARVAQLEAGAGRRTSAPARATKDASAPIVDTDGWTQSYELAQLEVADTWIELHEPSARPQLQRLLREVIATEGPVTDRLALDRIRRAWGLRRAGGRVQEAFDQAVRQLLARGLAARVGDALVDPSRAAIDVVRVPDPADEMTRRGAEEVPLVELVVALAFVARAARGGMEEDELTMAVAKLFGWTRRGGAIQVRLDAALDRALGEERVVRDGSRVRGVAPAAP